MAHFFGRSKKTKEVKVDKFTARPDFLWDMYKVKRTKRRIQLLPIDTPVFDDKIRCVCISDTHNRTTKWDTPLPDGDILLHCGDFTQWGKFTEVHQFDKFIATVPHRHKIVIAGNHDLSLDERLEHHPYVDKELKSLYKVNSARELLKNCCYLEDSFVIIGGYKIYGAPWTPEFYSMGFNYKRGEDGLIKWNWIPDDVDILMTHGPALGYGDKTTGGMHAGCAELLNTVQQRVRPMYHVSGHIHESNGVHTDGTTTFINAAICDRRYRPSLTPHIFDLPLKDGMSKEAALSVTLVPQSGRPYVAVVDPENGVADGESELPDAMSDMRLD